MKEIKLSKKQVKGLRDLCGEIRWRLRAANTDKIKEGTEMRKGRARVRSEKIH